MQKPVKTFLLIVGWALILLFLFYYLHLRKRAEDLPAVNVERLRRVSDYLKNSRYEAPKRVEFVLAIITAPRQYGAINLHYFTQVFGSFMSMMAHENVTDVGILICDASGDKANNADVIQIIGSENVVVYKIPATNVVEKELLDYIACLEAFDSKYPRVNYVVLNEDDAIPKEGFFDHVRQVINQMQMHYMRTGLNDISFVKLYHPERLRKLPFLIYLAVLPITFSGIACFISYCLGIQIRYGLPSLLFIAVSLMMVLMGPDSVGYLHQKLMLGHISLVAPESCCTPSLLYSRSLLKPTLTYLLERYAKDKQEFRVRAKDTILDDLSSFTAMRSLMTEFDFVEHIGFYSSLVRKS